MITRVRIQGYKSLRDVEIRFKPLTVIIGPIAISFHHPVE